MTLWLMAINIINVKPLLTWLSQSSYISRRLHKVNLHESSKVPHHCQ